MPDKPTNIFADEVMGPIRYFMAHGEYPPTISVKSSSTQVVEEDEDTIREKRTDTSRAFHAYIGRLVKGDRLIPSELRMFISDGLKYCRSTVTTHLLYAADVRGLNRQDIFEAAIPIILDCKPGYTFLQTLVRGLVRQDAWKLISLFINDDSSSRLNMYVLDTIAANIKKHNRKCLRGLPRQGRVANRIRGYLKMRPSRWRHVLAGGSRGSIFSFMSNNDWSKIEYRYLNTNTLATNFRAFMRHDKDRFKLFLNENPDISLAVKKRRFVDSKRYISQKEIYDTYLVPMKEDTSWQK